MKHTVFLVQKGISAPTHPVSGKSGKHYGTATQSPGHGVIFKMSLGEYRAAAHDVIGNTSPGQQWVPEIEAEVIPSVMSRGKCGIPAGCKEGKNGTPAEAQYAWETNLYCPGHAPLNATPLFEGADPIYSAGAKPPTQPETPDVLPRVIEREGQLIETSDTSAPEVMAPPAVSSDDAAPSKLGGIEKPVPTPTFPKKTPTPAERPQDTAQPAAAPSPVSAAAVVKGFVQEEVAAMEKRLLGEMRSMIDELRAPAAKEEKEPAPPSREKAASKSVRLASLRAEAKALGINTFQMSAEKIEKAIAAKQNGAGEEIKF